jgi:hypothetical protein
VSGDREKRRGGGRRGARGGRRREARRGARTFSNLVVCFTLKCTSELSCDGAAPRREGQSAFVRIRHRARVRAAHPEAREVGAERPADAPGP